MNDSQLITLAIAVSVPLGLLFLSNSRLTDVKEALRAEIRLSENKLEAKMDRGFERMDQKLDAVLKILADHEARLPK